jgi:hypothetical protein
MIYYSSGLSANLSDASLLLGSSPFMNVPSPTPYSKSCNCILSIKNNPRRIIYGD